MDLAFNPIGKTRPPRPKALVTYSRKFAGLPVETPAAVASLLSEEDPLIKERMGSICTWKIVHHNDPFAGVIICADNLAMMRLECFGHQLDKRADYLEMFKSLNLSLSSGLSHRITISRFERSASTKSKFLFFFIECFDINLIGKDGIDNACLSILEQLSLDLMRREPDVPRESWEKIVRNYPFVGMISESLPSRGGMYSPPVRKLCQRVQRVEYTYLPRKAVTGTRSILQRKPNP